MGVHRAGLQKFGIFGIFGILGIFGIQNSDFAKGIHKFLVFLMLGALVWGLTSSGFVKGISNFLCFQDLPQTGEIHECP